MKLARLVLTLTIALLTMAPLSAADFAGTWTLTGDVQGNAVNLNCAVKQTAEGALSGQCQVNGTESTEISGTTKDAAVNFSFTVAGYTLTYSGKVNGDAVSGDIAVAGTTGTFSGTRAKG